MLNEQQLEDLCLGWFQEAGWHFAHGPDIAPDSHTPERTDYRQVVLRERLLAALARINPHMPPPALEQTVVRGFFKPELFLDYVRHFVLFEHDGDGIQTRQSVQP